MDNPVFDNKGTEKKQKETKKDRIQDIHLVAIWTSHRGKQKK